MPPGRRRTGWPSRPRADALAKAVTDLTADPGSLVEALDDLGDPAAIRRPGTPGWPPSARNCGSCAPGWAGRCPTWSARSSGCSGWTSRWPPGPARDPASARADLDAFADAAAAFAGDQEEPTLGAFLAYLAAAEEEEFGLEAGRVGDSDSVKLATVHAAKGLQWPAVVVPGLAAGEKAQVFPAKPR